MDCVERGLPPGVRSPTNKTVSESLSTYANNSELQKTDGRANSFSRQAWDYSQICARVVIEFKKIQKRHAEVGECSCTGFIPSR